jgi:allantoate deiminase
MRQIEGSIEAEGVTVRRLPSGAGHDGMAMIDLTDIAMIFLRCTGGISHNPDEDVTKEDVAVGARVLMRFIENFRPKEGGV